MGKIYYIMGKSASGKDTVYKKILEAKPVLKTIILHTTRPKREGETEGVEYYFSSPEQLEEFQRLGKVIEARTYQTVLGPWIYATIDDGQIDLEAADYLVIGTLESYRQMWDYFGSEVLHPIYIYTDDGQRLRRAIDREEKQSPPNYPELCRRFLADERDFDAEKLRSAGIEKYYENRILEVCVKEVLKEIEG